MANSKLVFILIVVVLGSAVLASYVYAIKSYGGNVADFWGNFPKKFLSPYYVSMLLSAVSFFFFTSYILLNYNALTQKQFVHYGLPILYFLMLFGSAIWMPSVKLYLSDATSTLWITIRSILLIVGFSSLTITIMLLITRPATISAHFIMAVIASAYFCFHTLILDGFVWPHYFK